MSTTDVIAVALVLVGVACLALMWALGVGRMLSCRITDPERATGTVVGGSAREWCGHHTARVRYEVAGVPYEVDGPLFEWGTAGVGVRSNLSDRAHLPRALRAPNLVFPGVEWETQSNDWLYRYSAIAELYPVGSACDVWYDPADPSRAYVERQVRQGLVPTVAFGVWAVVALAGAAVMHAVG